MTQMDVPEAAENSARARVLLIDDSKLMRKAALKMLGGEFDVIVAEDGEEGWALITQDNKIQVVFTDLNMPVLDGFGLIERVRTSPDNGIRNLPVIVVTGHDDADDAKERVFELGATDFITKPFNSTDIKARAQAHADYQRNARELQEHVTQDATTGLLNQRGFDEQFEKDLSFVSRHHEDLALLKVELDAFNKLFVKIGRAGAEKIVEQVAKVLQQSVRREDTVARIGLATFLVSLPTAKATGAVELAQRICARVKAFKARVRGELLDITLSIGVCIVAKGANVDAVVVYEHAQQALTQATGIGSSQVQALRLGSQPEGSELLSVDRLLDEILLGDGQDIAIDLERLAQRLKPLLARLTAQQRQQLLGDI